MEPIHFFSFIFESSKSKEKIYYFIRRKVGYDEIPLENLHGRGLN